MASSSAKNGVAFRKPTYKHKQNKKTYFVNMLGYRLLFSRELPETLSTFKGLKYSCTLLPSGVYWKFSDINNVS